MYVRLDTLHLTGTILLFSNNCRFLVDRKNKTIATILNSIKSHVGDLFDSKINMVNSKNPINKVNSIDKREGKFKQCIGRDLRLNPVHKYRVIAFLSSLHVQP